MKKRTTIYLDEEIHDQIKRNNINLSELVYISIQNNSLNLGILKKKLAKTQKNLENLRETSENLRKNIQNELENLENLYINMSSAAQNYVIETKKAVESGRFGVIGRYKSYVKQYGDTINYSQFLDIIENFDIILEQKEAKYETNQTTIEQE